MSIIGLLGAHAAKSVVSGITSGLSGSIGQQLSYGFGNLTGYNRRFIVTGKQIGRAHV